MRSWSFYTSSASDTYAGHEGYDDELGSRYSYDSGVPNHSGPRPGDVIVLRDESGSRGVAFIEQIHTEEGSKLRRHCPYCGTSQMERRITLSPKFRCTNGHTFENPKQRSTRVVHYRAEYGGTFRECRELEPKEIEALCLARSKQNAIRELDLDRTFRALRRRGIVPSFVDRPAG
jgi:hypothetical protein